MASLVAPGDRLCGAQEYDSGAGTYVRAGAIYASLLGTQRVVPAAASASSTDSAGSGGGGGARGTVVVVRSGDGSEGSEAAAAAAAPDVGSLVLARVTRITSLLANCEVLVCDGTPLPVPFSAVIRKEHVREAEMDGVRMDAAFRPGDLVQARVASMGDARSYFLSTAGEACGVVYARSEAGNVMRGVSWEEMEDGVTGAREKRKVARVAGGAGGAAAAAAAAAAGGAAAAAAGGGGGGGGGAASKLG
jgi:exosome complex component CSL4